MPVLNSSHDLLQENEASAEARRVADAAGVLQPAPGKTEIIALRLARVETLKQHLVPVSLAGVAVASVLLWATWGLASAWGSIWFVGVLLVTLLRLSFLRTTWGRRADASTWLKAFGLSALLSGLIWGSTAWVFYVPGSEKHQLLLAFLLGGLTSGAAASLGCYVPVYLAWVAPAVLPLTLRLALEGDPTHLGMAATLGFFVLAMGLVAQGTERAFRRNVGLAFEKQALLETLLEARAELQAANRELDARVRERTRALEAAERARLRVEQERRHAQKLEAIGRLTGGVAHDFNNLLAVVLNALPQVQARARDDAELASLVRSAEQAAQRGARLTESLLAFSRSQRLNPTTLDLGATLSQMQSDLLGAALGKRVTVSCDVASDLWPVHVDPDQLCTALLNLAVNARDAMPHGGRLAIAAENHAIAADPALDDGDYVSISFEDEGTGMPDHVLERAFEPFFTTKAVGEGSGLGLSMVYGFARQSGGDARLRSEPGVGTTVTLWLPRAAGSKPSRSISEPAGPIPRGAGELILLVEDEPELRRVVVRLLTNLGYRVESANDAGRALARLEANANVDVLLSDVVMPGELDGFGLARAARALCPELPVVLVSGYPEGHGGSGGEPISDSEFVFLRKPFQPAQLALTLQQVLHPASGQGP